MGDGLYMNVADRKRIATKWVVITLWGLHIWASIMVLAVVLGDRPSKMLADMFSTVCFGIGATLAILLLDRAADILLSRFALPVPPPAEVKETLTHTVRTTPAPEGEGAKS